jgi:hypothetical protein
MISRLPELSERPAERGHALELSECCPTQVRCQQLVVSIDVQALARPHRPICCIYFARRGVVRIRHPCCPVPFCAVDHSALLPMFLRPLYRLLSCSVVFWNSSYCELVPFADCADFQQNRSQGYRGWSYGYDSSSGVHPFPSFDEARNRWGASCTSSYSFPNQNSLFLGRLWGSSFARCCFGDAIHLPVLSCRYDQRLVLEARRELRRWGPGCHLSQRQFCVVGGRQSWRAHGLFTFGGTLSWKHH